MKLIPSFILLFFPLFVLAEDFRLELLLGQIESVTIEAAIPKTGKNVLDHSCGSETVKFQVSEYLSGNGANERELGRTLASYNCDSSWDGAPVSPSIAMVSRWPTHYLYRGVARLTHTSEGLQVVDTIPELLRVLAIHGQKNPNDFLVDLKEPVVRYRGVDQGADELKCLSSLGAIEYKTVDVDLNENCISGCEKRNVVAAYEVIYKKGIPLSKLRGKNF